MGIIDDIGVRRGRTLPRRTYAVCTFTAKSTAQSRQQTLSQQKPENERKRVLAAAVITGRPIRLISITSLCNDSGNFFLLFVQNDYVLVFN